MVEKIAIGHPLRQVNCEFWDDVAFEILNRAEPEITGLGQVPG